MGCDGGTIPRRDELVKTKKKPEQKDKEADLAAKWKLCAITQDPLIEPIMACELGRLYNKESVLELLIDRTKFECASSFSHLRGLKDVKELKLTENKDFTKNKAEKGDRYIDTHAANFICPVVGIGMNGSHKFCFIWNCGCVLSERALKEVKGENCHKCGKAYSTDEVVVLNPGEEELDVIRSRMEEERRQQKLEKKTKKSKKQKCETATADETDTDCAPSTSKQTKLDPAAASSKLTNGEPGKEKPSNGDKVAKVSKEKLTNGSTGKSTGLANGVTKSGTVAKSGSVQDDPKASKVYKSIFCSSDKAKNQMKAHWVTYNPYWN